MSPGAVFVVAGAALTYAIAPFVCGRPQAQELSDCAASELREEIEPDEAGTPDPGAATPEAPLTPDTSHLDVPLIRDTVG